MDNGGLEGIEPGRTRPNSFFLRKVAGTFRVGDDVITFGPGQADHEMIRMEGANFRSAPGALTAGPLPRLHHRLHPVHKNNHHRLRRKPR